MVDYNYEGGIRHSLLEGIYPKTRKSIYAHLVSPVPLVQTIESLIGKEVITLSLVSNRDAYLPHNSLVNCRFQKGIIEGIHKMGFMHLKFRGERMLTPKVDVSAVYDMILADNLKLLEGSCNTNRTFKYKRFHDNQDKGHYIDGIDPVSVYNSLVQLYHPNDILILESVSDI